MALNSFLQRSVKTRVTLFTLVIFVLSLWMLSFYASRMLREDMQLLLGEDMQLLLGDQQQTTVSFVAEQINQELEARLQILNKVAGIISPAILSKPADLQALLEARLILQGPFNGGAFVTGLNGVSLASVPLFVEGVPRIGVSYMDRDYMITALREGKPAIGKPVMGKLLRSPVFLMAVPILDAQGKVMGALAGVINLGKPNFLDKIIANPYGKTGGYLLEDPKNRLIITGTDKRRIMQSLPAAGVNWLIDRHVDGYDETGVTVNPLGVEVLASARRIPVAGWFIVVSLPTAEAFAPIHALQLRMLLATILLTLLAGILTWWMLRRQLSPLLLAAHTLTTRPDSSEPLPVIRQDEIGQMIGGFNRLLEILRQREEALSDSAFLLRESQRIGQLGGWQADPIRNTVMWTEGVYEITELPLDFKPDLETALDVYLPDSRARVVENLTGAIQTGKSFSIQVQVRGAQSGMNKWCELRGFPQNVAGGRIDYLTGTLQDISERKQTEAALLESEARLSTIIDNEPECIKIIDAAGRLTLMNPAGLAMIEAESLSQVVGHQVLDVIAPEFRTEYAQLHQRVMAGETMHMQYQVLGLKGHRRWLETHAVPMQSGGETVHLAVTRDIEEYKQAEAALKHRQTMLTRTEGIAHVGSWEWDVATDATKWSDEMFRIFQRDPAEGAPSFAEHPALYLPEDLQRLKDAVNAALNHGMPYELELRGIRRDDATRVCLARGQVEVDAGKRVTRLFGSLQDITERKQAEQALQLAASVFSIAREGIMITDTDGTIIDVNDAFTRITGFGHDEVIGKNPHILSSGRHGPELYAAMWRDLKEKGYWQGEIWNRRKNGEVYAEMQTISTVRDPEGNARQYVSLFSDITSIKEHQKQLEHIAHYDALTSLPNRVLLADRLHQAMAQAQRRESMLAVAYLDLDGFTAVNDHHGHEVGDQLLTTVAARMKDSLREGDTLGRIGGDEFVAVLVDLSGVEDSVPMLGRLLAVVAEPVRVGELTLQVSASLGVTFYPQDEDIDADQLQRQADQAMYQAKLAGKNRYHMFDATQDRSVRGLHESLEQIRQALAERQFALYYQPKVNMRTGEVIGAEALIRWQHPQRGLLSPALFLPVVEDNALAIDLGEWVIDTALTQIETWHADGISTPVSVNVGALQLQHPDFVLRLRTLLSRHPRVNHGELELEILETSALEDFVGVTQVMAACQELGVGFALDDFGTGYSSLTYLKQLPVGLLKVDQSFVRDMLDDPGDLAILEGVLGLATAFRRQVIAEGVETLAQGEMLLRLGCEWAQGYAIARPMPAQDFLRWRSTWDAPPAWKALEPISRDRLPALFAAVEHRAWICAIVHYLSGKRDMPPERDTHQCRFGHWLDHGGRALLLHEGTDHAVDELHRDIHRLAAELITLKRDGRPDEVQTDICELHRLRDQLLEHLSELY